MISPATKRVLLPWLPIVLAGIGMWTIAHTALRSFPHSADEYVYLYQARTFLEGRVVNPPAPDPSLLPVHVVGNDAGDYGKYPPAWPALLAVGAAMGLPFAVNAALGMVMLWLVWRIGLGLFDRPAGLAALVLLGTSPLFLLHGASLYAHPLAGLALLAMAASLWRYHETLGISWLLAATASLGVLTLTRPFDAALACVAVLPFLLAQILREPKRSALHGLAALPVLLAFLGTYLVYNASTTGDPFTPGHVRSGSDMPSWTAFYYAGPTLRRIREYGFSGYPLLLFPLGLFVLRRDVRGPVLAFTGLLVVVVLVGYASYHIDPPPRLGPRYLYGIHAFIVLVLAGALVRTVRSQWVVPLIVTIGIGQLFTTVMVAREVGSIVGDGTAVYRAANALARAIAPEKAVVVLAGPSGRIPGQDLARNDFEFQQPVLFARNRSVGDDPWKRAPFRGRRIFYWDGLGGVPVLWTAEPEAAFQQVIAAPERSWGIPPAVESGWFTTFGISDCAPVPYLTLMWGAAFPPSYELSDVQRAPKGFYGPCPGFVDVRRLERVEVPGDLPVQRPIQGHLRSFLTVRSSGTYTARLEGNEEAVLRVGGVVVATSRDGVPASASIELAEGTHPVAISFFTLRSQPSLDFRLTGGNGGERRWRFTTQAPSDTRFHPRLVQTRFTR